VCKLSRKYDRQPSGSKIKQLVSRPSKVPKKKRKRKKTFSVVWKTNKINIKKNPISEWEANKERKVSYNFEAMMKVLKQ
jgi:hypothetical protein